MRHRPMAAAAINPAVPRQEREKLLALTPKVVGRRLASTHKIAHRLMRRIRRHTPVSSPARCSRANVTASPLARSFRDQRRSDHHAVMAERLNLAIKPVSRRPGFEANTQSVVPLRQSLDRPLDRQRTIFDITEKPDLSPPPSFRDRNGVLLLGDVESHKDFAMLSHGPPSVHEARLGLPEQPSFLPARKGSPREHDV